MSDSRDIVKEQDVEMFKFGRDYWIILFPETLGESISGNEFFPKIYDEISAQLKVLDDVQYTSFQRNSFSPLDIRESYQVFQNIGIFLSRLAKLENPSKNQSLIAEDLLFLATTTTYVF